MKKWFKLLKKFRKKYGEDLEYLIVVGLPTGILTIVLYAHLDFSKLF